MLSNFGRFLLPIFIIAIIFTLADALISLYNLQILNKNEQEVMRSQEFLFHVESTFSTLQDMETGQRGYLLTGSSRFLEPYTLARKELPAELASLEEYSQKKPEKKGIIEKLELVIRQRDAFLVKVIEMYNSGSTINDLLPYIEQGKAKMDQTRTLITDIEINETKQLNMRLLEEKQSIERILITLGISSLFTLFLIFIAYYLIRRELSIRHDLEKRKDEFISLASHELRTPLTSMKLFNEIVQKRVKQYKDKDINRYTTKIEEQILRLSDLVKDLLDLSRIQTGKLELHGDFFNLDQLIEDIIDGLQGTTNKHKFIFKTKFKQRMYGDRYRIYQVLTNLMTNAMKYSPKGGNIIIVTKKQEKDVLVSIRDYGIGIEKQHRDRIFERLYRVRTEDTASASGLGIGLFISSDIVIRHGGRIWVESEKGKGSTFYFTLPIKRRKLS